MSDPAQVEADALLARRLQEEEYLAANLNMPMETFGGVPPSRPGMSPDAHPHRPSNFPLGHRPSEPSGGSGPRGGLDPVLSSMLNQFMGRMQAPGAFGGRQDLRESAMQGMDAWGFPNPSRNSAQDGIDSFDDGPRGSQNTHRYARDNINATRPELSEPSMRGPWGSRPATETHRPPSSQPSSRPPRHNDGFAPNAFSSEQRSGSHGGNSPEPSVLRDAPASVRQLFQMIFGGPNARRDDSNDGRSGDSGPAQYRRSGIIFGMGGTPFGSGGATFVTGTTATAGPGGATASAQAGTFPGGTTEQTFTFSNPEDVMTFFRQNLFSDVGAETDDVFNFLRSNFFANGEAPETYEDFINLMERMGTVNRSATDEEIDSLPSHQYVNRSAKARRPAEGPSTPASTSNDGNSDQDDKCAICLGDYEQDEEVKNMPCGHLFHSECLGRWLKINRTCPICKQSLRDGDGPTE